MIEWYPGDTAPKDGRWIIGGWEMSGVAVCFFDKVEGKWSVDYGFELSTPPTHWTPVPDAPGCVDIPSKSEIVEVLRSASRMIEGSGMDERMDDYSTLNRIDSILSRLELE